MMAPTTTSNANAEELHILWPNYQPSKSNENELLALIKMINEKFRERLPAWQIIALKPEHFPQFFADILRLILDDKLPFAKQIELVTFLDNCFNSLEVELVRQEVGKLCALPIWVNLLPV